MKRTLFRDTFNWTKTQYPIACIHLQHP